MLNDPDLATKLADELLANEHVSSVEMTPVDPAMNLAVIGWDTPLLSVTVSPYRVNIVTQDDHEQYLSLPQRYADEVRRNLRLMNAPTSNA